MPFARTIPLTSAVLLLAAAAPPAKPAKPELTDADLIKAAGPALKRVPGVVWTAGQSVVGDVNFDGRKDVVFIGVDKSKGDAVVAIVPGPVGGGSAPIVIRLAKPKNADAKPTAAALCGDAVTLHVGLESPGVKPSDLGCAQGAMDAKCHHVLDTEMKLQQARNKGGRGIILTGGTCLPLHIYFADGAFHKWRND